MSKRVLLFLFLTCSVLHYISGQLTEEQRSSISVILKPVSYPDKPGVSAAIIREGEVIFSQANGLANLVSGDKANTRTLYNVDALAKQFTTLAFLKFVESEVVHLDDDIRHYLPELPIYDNPILLRHILNHTTGLNNYTVVQQLTGIPTHRGFSNQDALAIIASQKSLSYQPGSQFSFFDSNTESLLMAEVIGKSSGMTFPEYVYQNVFLPLGLSDAIFVSDYDQIIPNMAMPYVEMEGKLTKNSNTDNIVGPSNLYISIADIAKWYSFFSPQKSNKKYDIVKQLDTPVSNVKGKRYVSGWGEMTIGRSYLHMERGLPKYWQYGLKSSYGANVFRFPDLDLTTIAIGNNNSYNGMYAMPLVSSFTEDHFLRPATIEMNSIGIHPMSINEISQWAGEFYNPITGQIRLFEMRQDTLRYIRGSRTITLLPIARSSFQAILGSEDILKFHFGKNGNKKYYDVTSFEGDEQRYYSFDSNFQVIRDDLEDFVGMYANTDLGQIFTFSVRENQLVATHNRIGEIEFRNIKKDLFVSDIYALSSIEFHRKNKTISHFTIKSGGINNLSYHSFVLKSIEATNSSCCKAEQQ